MKRRCCFLTVSFMFVCSLLLAGCSCYVKYEECFYSIHEEVVLISEFGVLRNSNNNDLGVGVISFKVGDILYGIGHYSNLPEDSSLSVYKVIAKEILPSTKDNIGEIFLGVNNINEEDFIGRVIEDSDNGMLISTDQLDTKQYSTISVAKEIFQGNAELLMRDEEGKLQSYAISVKIASNFFEGKYLEICIKDEKLLAKTGGIVQGMSGSPIIQNGKLIGCITHVLLDDPQRGYGAFIENMINDLNNI